jgi:hypothetical protein
MLQQALSERREDVVLVTVRTIKAQAGMYGFESLAEVSRLIEQRISSEHLSEELWGSVLQLIKLCSRVKAPSVTLGVPGLPATSVTSGQGQAAAGT